MGKKPRFIPGGAPKEMQSLLRRTKAQSESRPHLSRPSRDVVNIQLHSLRLLWLGGFVAPKELNRRIASLPCFECLDLRRMANAKQYSPDISRAFTAPADQRIRNPLEPDAR
jgi:hypothetical protein